jgi:DNA repair ATPase RecN
MMQHPCQLRFCLHIIRTQVATPLRDWEEEAKRVEKRESRLNLVSKKKKKFYPQIQGVTKELHHHHLKTHLPGTAFISIFVE